MTNSHRCMCVKLLCVYVCVHLSAGGEKKETEGRDHRVWSLLQYFLTLSIQVPLALGDYEIDWICYDAYDQCCIIIYYAQCSGHAVHFVHLTTHIFQSTFSHTLICQLLCFCEPYTKLILMFVHFKISTQSQMATIDFDRTDCVSWTVFHWVKCRECCINRCDIIGLSIVFCCRGLCMC